VAQLVAPVILIHVVAVANLTVLRLALHRVSQ